MFMSSGIPNCHSLEKTMTWKLLPTTIISLDCSWVILAGQPAPESKSHWVLKVPSWWEISHVNAAFYHDHLVCTVALNPVPFFPYAYWQTRCSWGTLPVSLRGSSFFSCIVCFVLAQAKLSAFCIECFFLYRCPSTFLRKVIRLEGGEEERSRVGFCCVWNFSDNRETKITLVSVHTAHVGYFNMQGVRGEKPVRSAVRAGPGVQRGVPDLILMQVTVCALVSVEQCDPCRGKVVH